MTEDRLVRELSLLGDLLAIEGRPNSRWRSAAFHLAAKKLRTGKIALPIPQNPVEKEVVTAVTQLRANGSCQLFKTLSIPGSVAEFLQVPGIDLDMARHLYQEEIESLGDLEDAINEGTFTDPRIIKALKDYKNIEIDLFPHPKMRKLYQRLAEVFTEAGITTELAGSMRRWKPAVRNIDIVCEVYRPQQKNEILEILTKKLGTHPRGNQDVIETTLDSTFAGIGLRVFLAQPKNKGAVKIFATGSREHVLQLRNRFSEKNLLLIRTGVFRNGHLIAGKNEREVYSCIGLPFHPPELREWDLQDKESLLVEKNHVDLHIHTNHGIGQPSIDQVVRQAIQQKLEAIAICDRYSKIENFNNYLKAVQQAKVKYASFLKIFCSVEADIDLKGNIEVPNHPLLDYVTASILQNPQFIAQNRLIKAMQRYPRIKLIAHPLGRRVADTQLPPIEDWEDVFRTASTLGVTLQINANPRKIDLPARLVRYAKRFGCKFSIDSDSRYLSEVGNLTYGVKCAQRAALSPFDVADLVAVENWCTHENKK